MTNTANEFDYLVELFGGTEMSADEQAAMEERMAANLAAEQLRIKNMLAAQAAEKLANRCPKCSGEGRIAQFSHRKGGECFLCGGSGVFTNYRA